MYGLLSNTIYKDDRRKTIEERQASKKEIEQYLSYMICTYIDDVYGAAESGDKERIKKTC